MEDKIIKIDKLNRLLIKDNVLNGIFIFQQSKLFDNWDSFNSFLICKKEGLELIKIFKEKFGEER